MTSELACRIYDHTLLSWTRFTRYVLLWIYKRRACQQLRCLAAVGIDWDSKEGEAGERPVQLDGMETLIQVQKKQRFGPDLRLMEVCILQASERHN